MKDKIAFFSKRLLPSSETFIYHQALNLRSFEPVFVALRHVKGLLRSDQIITPPKRLSFIRELTYILFQRYSGIERKLMHVNPQIIHAHFGPGGVLGLPLKESLEVPLITTFHGLDITANDDFFRKGSITSRVYLRYRSRLASDGDMFIAVSQFIKQQLIEKGFPEEKILQHYIGIDVEMFKSAHDTKRIPSILFVGRLVKKKGLIDLLRAMKIVESVIPHAKLIVVGAGPDLSYGQFYARENNLTASFLGYQPQSVIKELMQKSQVYCGPSHTADNGDSEGLGMVFLEAQAMGLPVVSYRHGGVPEAVIHNETGLLVKENDVQGLAASICQLMTDENLRMQYSRNARVHVEKNFCVSKQTASLEGIYKALLA